MITSQVIQTCIEDLKRITRVEIGVFDINGGMVASTNGEMSVPAKTIVEFSKSLADSQVIGDQHLLKVMDEDVLAYVLVAKGNNGDIYMVGKIAVSELQNLIVAYKERYDKNSFFQNLLLDNLLLIDIYNRAKKLHIDVKGKRVVYLIEARIEKDSPVTDMLKGMFSSQSGDFVTAVDESNVILVKSVEDSSREALQGIANSIADMMSTEIMVKARVSYGNIVEELKDVSKSYKEAKMAMDVGKIFYNEKNVFAYSTLGIGRLIYQLPVNLCKLYIDEIFGGEMPEDLDEEMLNMIDKFFENNLNVSEASRQLFVHRNTLVYRLEKLAKSIGLDVRNFDDALTFKIALMVCNYMKYLNHKDL